MRLWPLFVVLSRSLVRAQDREAFSEKLWIEPFRDGKLLAQFEFTTVLDDVPRHPDTLDVEDAPQHYTVVPLALGQVLREYSVTELHLSLNAGKWNYGSWGTPIIQSVASGAELWAWMGHTTNDTSEIIDTRWHKLTNALAGLFCASLGSMDAKRTTIPKIAFRPEGNLPGDYPHSLRYSSLPSESVCTENLTPFVKLLPCKAHSGIASLLNPHRLFDADWHGMSITVRWLENTGVEIRLGFGAVMDPVRLSGDSLHWSSRLLFDKALHRSCLVASRSKVLVGMGPTTEGAVLVPYGQEFIKVSDTRSLVVYDVSHNPGEFDLAQQWVDEQSFTYTPVPRALPVSIRRVLTGAEQTHGGLLLSITNQGDTNYTTAWLETMPWFIQFFLHTLELRVDGKRRDDLLQHLTFTPPRDDLQHSSMLEAVLSVPPKSRLDVSISFRKAFILYTEHPPDAHRGWDLPAAVLTPVCSDPSGSCGERMYTSTLLVDLATPDFSMPYNVIIMSSTVVALFFGSIFNLLTRKFVVVRVGKT
ncbi:Gpi16 subunit, GPI transamidase component [Ceratobasidium sp. AG-Ba]|nr:Gpi16 subunit, GPI transamidase component [Ceratobasidium sp. AG-Ba]